MIGAIIIEGHVQGLANTRSLGQTGIPVYVLNRERHCIARYSRYCTRFFRCPPYDSDALALFLAGLAKQEGAEGWLVFPSNDHAVATLSRNREQLSGLLRVMVPRYDKLMDICDKLLLMRSAMGAGVPVPETWSTGEVQPEKISYPCLLKGRLGLSFFKATGKKGIVCHDSGTLRQELNSPLLTTHPNLAMVQRLISPRHHQPTLSVASFCIDGEMKGYWMGKKLREHPFRFGTATLTESVHEDGAVLQAQKLMKALHYNGIAETEFIRDPDTGEYVLIEINPRTWLWAGHAAACGSDFATMAWNHYVHGHHDWPSPGEYITGLKWRNFYPDLFFSLKAILEGKLTLTQWFQQNRGRKVHAVWHHRDPLPFMMLTMTLPLIALQRQNP
jgi:D-aspartate ligase